MSTFSSYGTDGTPHLRPSTSSQNLTIQRSSTPSVGRGSPKVSEYPEVVDGGKKQQHQSSIVLGVVFVAAILCMMILFQYFPEVSESVARDERVFLSQRAGPSSHRQRAFSCSLLSPSFSPSPPAPTVPC